MNNEQLLEFMLGELTEAVSNHQDDMSVEELAAFLKGWKEATLCFTHERNLNAVQLRKEKK